jgi:hypothetical protein
MLDHLKTTYKRLVKGSDRSARQMQFSWRVTILFIAFCLFATPLQIHVEWYGGLATNRATWFSDVLKNGALFFYAFTLCVEAFFRLSRYPLSDRKDFRLFFLKMALWIPIIAFVFEYFISPDYRSGAHIGELAQLAQIITAVGALVLSTLTHQVTVTHELRTIR